MRLNKTTYPNLIFKIFKMKMLITMLGWKMQMRFKVMMNKIIHLFCEGGSVICKELSIVADGVLFIEDKLTSLEFDNAGNQTLPSDEEFEWNDDNAVVSNDAKHMKRNEQNDQKCCC